MKKKGRPLVSATELKFYLVLLLVLAFLSALVTALVLVSGSGEEEIPNRLPGTTPFQREIPLTLTETPRLQDFYFPRPGGRWLDRQWFYSRLPNPDWDPEMVSEYWQDPDSFEFPDISGRVDQSMDDLFREVP